MKYLKISIIHLQKRFRKFTEIHTLSTANKKIRPDKTLDGFYHFIYLFYLLLEDFFDFTVFVVVLTPVGL
jgi:hypothetical protein